MGLNENPVDLFEIDDAGLVPDRLDKRAQRQVPGPTQEAMSELNAMLPKMLANRSWQVRIHS